MPVLCQVGLSSHMQSMEPLQSSVTIGMISFLQADFSEVEGTRQYMIGMEVSVLTAVAQS